MSTFVPRLFPTNAFDAAIGKIAEQAVSSYARVKPPPIPSDPDIEQTQPVESPADAIALLVEILEEMAAGRGVTLIPENAELTTFQAADLLNVSHPYVIKLLEENKLPYRKVDGIHRIRADDLMVYEAAFVAKREAVLDQLVAESQAMGLYDM